MRRYLIYSSLSILFTVSVILIYLSFYGIKTNSFNDLIVNKIKEFNPKLTININDVFLKLNIKEKSINIRTQNAKIFIDNEFIKLSQIDLNLNILNFLRNENSIKKIKISIDKNKIKKITNFINSYKFSIPRLLIFNQINDGNITAEINIIFNDKDLNDYTFDVDAKVRDAKLNILNEYKIEKINLDLKIKDNKYIIKNTTFNNEGINFVSKQILIENKKDDYIAEGDLVSKKGLVNPKYFIKFLNYKINFLEDQNILAETKNKFKFRINSKNKIKDFNLSSKINFEEIFINKKIQNLISLQNGTIRTNYKKDYLEIDIDSGYAFLNKNNQNNKNDKITAKIIKNKDKNFIVNAFVKNENNSIISKELSKYFKNINRFIKDQNLQFGSSNKINFVINEKNKVENLKIKSKLNLGEILVNYDISSIKKILPDYKNSFKLKTNIIEIDYSKNNLKINSSGLYSIDSKYDKFDFNLIKNKKNFNFNSKISLDANKVLFEDFDYKKKKDLSSTLSFDGRLLENKKKIFEKINYIENQNSINILNLQLTNNYKIVDLDSLKLEYLNDNNKLNELIILKKNEKFKLIGKNFDGKLLIKNLLSGDKKNNFLKRFKNLNKEISINFDQFFVDDKDYLNDLKGNFIIKNNIVNSGFINAKLNNKNDFNLNIKTNTKKEKITNLFIENPRPFIQNFNFIKGFDNGKLSFSSIEKNNLKNSNLKIYNFKIKEVPVLAKILTLASLQGIADLLTGEGIRFDDFEMDYSSEEQITKINEIYAIGPAISILMSGYIEKNKITSLRGTLVPATTINKTIAKLPLVGELLVGKKTGEGVFGVSFKIKGPPKNLKTTVNPVKTLTPRFITRTLDKLKKN